MIAGTLDKVLNLSPTSERENVIDAIEMRDG
jgi:hypothetical protein